MNDRDCVRFLQRTLPRLHLRWQGYRRVRRQVCKRVQRRIRELQIRDVHAYLDYLDEHPEEWAVLDACCYVTVSRFYRDKLVFRLLEEEILPDLVRRRRARNESGVRIWSAGCGSGEEPYTLAILWRLSRRPEFGPMDLRVLATEVNPVLLQRARAACYSATSLKNLPSDWCAAAFDSTGQNYCLRSEYRDAVDLRRHDIRDGLPDGPFDAVLCRNLAFTYFDEALQRQVARQFAEGLLPGGALVLGAHESLPAECPGFSRSSQRLPVYHRV